MNACIFCGQKIKNPLSLTTIFSYQPLATPIVCDTCIGSSEPIDLQTACGGCSRPQKGQSFCSDCRRWTKEEPFLTLNHTALFTYNEWAKEFMQRYKFQGDIILAELLIEQIANALVNYQNTHHIVPIPISETSTEQRGFNQVQLLLNKAGVPYEKWLGHIGKGPRQASKTREKRLRTDQFLTVKLKNNEHEKIAKPILLVDDVYTTGRTILHAKNAFQFYIKNIQEQFPDKKIDRVINIESFSVFR